MRAVARPLGRQQSASVKATAGLLREALHAFRSRHGFGRALAAPQLGQPVRMLALALEGWPDIVLNPEITWRSSRQVTLWDDCMCFPSLLVRVQRQASISVRFQDLNGVKHQREQLPVDLSELFQHEIDHLDGLLSMDRAVGEDPIVSRVTFDAQPERFQAQVSYPGDDTTVSQPQLTNRYLDPYRYPAGVAYMEGQYVPVSQARVSVLDYGFLHSDATYDTVHVCNGRFFRLDRHLDRFFGGLARLRLDPGRSREAIQEILCHCVALSGLRDAYVEMICTRGTSPEFSRDPRQAENRFLAFAVPYGAVASEAQLQSGLHLAIGSNIRIPARSVDSAIKNYHWLDLVQGLFDAYDREADNAILLNEAGHIAEGPGFNIFMLSAGALKTPARDVLAGITRETVFELCGDYDLTVTSTDITVAELLGCEEAFITSTAGGIMPVTRIDGQPIGSGRVGVVTRRLMDGYWEKHQDPDWTTLVRYRNSAPQQMTETASGPPQVQPGQPQG